MKLGSTCGMLLLGMGTLAGLGVSPAAAQESIVFSSSRPFPGSTGWEMSLFRMNADGTGMTDLTPGWPTTPQPEWRPAVSPDGEWVAVVADGSLWRMRLDGSDLTFVTSPAMIHTNAWSADGSRIYFSTPSVCADGLSVVGADGSGRQVVVFPGVDIPEPAIAQVAVSVNDEVAFVGASCGTAPQTLYLMNADGTDIRPLLHGTNLVAWAPDGERLALSRCTLDPDFPGMQLCQIWTVNRDGTNLRQLTPTERTKTDVDPAWSPDGQHILFARYGFANYPYTYSAAHLFVMNADGSDVRQLTFGDAVYDRYPVWVGAADSTAPVIVPAVLGTLGANGWYTSDVAVSWSISDPESEVTSTSGCEDVTVTQDTAGATYTCTAVSAGGTSTESVSIKRDTSGPSVTCSATPALLWPANHKLWDVTATATALDDLSAVRLTGLEVLSNEADSGLGDGDLPFDIQGFPPEMSTSGQLRAERAGNGSGRQYAIAFTVADQAGNTGTCAATVRVPHDQGNGGKKK